MTTPSGLRVLTAATVTLGGIIAATADLALFTVDDSCPQWEDEGTMAAPGSAYSRLMCGPGVEPPAVWAVYLAVALAVALGLVVLARADGRTRAPWPWLVAILVAPVLLVGLLHAVLPQDCLSGRTPAGHCGRDREAR